MATVPSVPCRVETARNLVSRLDALLQDRLLGTDTFHKHEQLQKESRTRGNHCTKARSPLAMKTWGCLPEYVKAVSIDKNIVYAPVVEMSG